MTSLEQTFYGSQAIRNFLKLFSEQHWNRVSKATILVGITRLAELADRKGQLSIAQLSVEDIENLAVRAHEKHSKRKTQNPADTQTSIQTSPHRSALKSSAKRKKRHGDHKKRKPHS